MNRNLYLPVVFLCLAAAPAAGDVAREDLVAEVLKRVPDWPQAQVEMPLSVYEKIVREILAGSVPPQPPQVAWIERLAWRIKIAESEVIVAPVFDVVSLPGAPPQAVRVLPMAIAWRDATVDGRKIDLRQDKDGWFYFDPPKSGRYRVAAKASIKRNAGAGGQRIALAAPKAALASLSVESDEAWEVWCQGSPRPVVGGEKGTRGTVGLAPGESLAVAWHRPQPPVHREARIEAESRIGWTLGEGTHQVRAVLNLRLWGGEVSELTVNLPPGADRVAIAGPDVREVQVQGTSARVFLRGAITQRTRLDVAFESPRPATGRMVLPAFGVAGAAQRGGTVAIAGGAGGVLLEMDSPGLVPMALADLPDETRGLLSAPAMYAYTLSGGAWEARVDLVGMSEFPVRETLADSALYTVLYRPDGHIMVKVIYEVRNRGQQYMQADLPHGAELVVARVAEQQKSLARGPGDTVYVPLEKSVLTTAGLISFPVEIVYLVKGEPLTKAGTFRLPLPRIDLPVAYARCALMVPEGMKVRQWQGVLRQVPAWSSETANLEFQYGTGHAAAPPKAVKVPRLGNVPARGDLFGAGAPEPEPGTPEATVDLDGQGRYDNGIQAQMLQAKNLYRAGVDSYQRGNYAKAGELFGQLIQTSPKSVEAENARKYLGNIDIAKGKDAGAKEDRAQRATAKAVQLSQQAGNVEIREKQQEVLEQAEQALQRRDVGQAEAAYKVAVGLAERLSERGEQAREQEARVRKAKEFLGKQESARLEESKKLADLQQQVTSLKGSIEEKGGKEMAQAIDSLVGAGEIADRSGGTMVGGLVSLGRGTPGGTRGATPTIRKPSDSPAPQPGQAQIRPGLMPPLGAQVPQIEMGKALAEQQVTLGAKFRSSGRAPQAGWGDFGGDAPRFEVRDLTQAAPWAAGGGLGGGGAGQGPAAQPRIAELQKQVEKLKSIEGELAATAAVPDLGRGPTRKPAQATTDVPRAGTGTGKVGDGRQPATPSSTSAIRQLADEKANRLTTQAKRAEDLARQGRVVEAEQLIKGLDKDAEVASRAAQVLRGGFGGEAPRFEAAGAREASRRAPDQADRDKKIAPLWDRATELRRGMKFSESIEVLDRILALSPNDERATRWREDLLYLDPQARQVAVRPPREQARKAVESRADVDEAAVPPGEPVRGRTSYLKYPEAKDSKQLTQSGREFSKPVAAEPKAVAETRRRLAQEVDLDYEKVGLNNVLAYIGDRGLNIVIDPAVFAAGIDLSTRVVDLKVKGVSIESVLSLTLGADLGYKVEPGYVRITTKAKSDQNLPVVTYPVEDLLIRIPPPREGVEPPGLVRLAPDESKAMRAAHESIEKARQVVRAKSKELDKVKINVADITLDMEGDKRLAEFVANNYSWALQANAGVDSGILELPNDPRAVRQVEQLIERLRVNMGQRVPVGSRNILVADRAARAAGIKWQEGANGVIYGLANEGQLLALLDLEQRAANTVGVAPPATEVRQETIVGTDAIVANGGMVNVAQAADEANTVSYNGNSLRVAHDDYVIISNGAYLTAIKTGRMQHWAAEVEPVRFPGVPAAVVVPAVGYTVKFEKTLLDPSDNLEMSTDYTWQGEKQ